MKVWKSPTVMAMVLATMTGPTFGCDCNCDPLDPMESGDYLIADPAYGRVHAGDEWLIGGELHVDREAHSATIRYIREGTTYEVRYTLVQ